MRATITKRVLSGLAVAAFAITQACSGGTSGSSGVPFVCWLSAGRCDCKPNATVPSGGTKVSNCTTQQFGYCCQYSNRCGCDDNPGCGSGGRDVAVCENRYASSPAGPTCPGSGYISCSDSSVCPCGLFCSRLSSSSTDKYCTQSCSTDDECTSSSQWSFSPVGCSPIVGVCVP